MFVIRISDKPEIYDLEIAVFLKNITDCSILLHNQDISEAQSMKEFGL